MTHLMGNDFYQSSVSSLSLNVDNVILYDNDIMFPYSHLIDLLFVVIL